MSYNFASSLSARLKIDPTNTVKLSQPVGDPFSGVPVFIVYIARILGNKPCK